MVLIIRKPCWTLKILLCKYVFKRKNAYKVFFITNDEYVENSECRKEKRNSKKERDESKIDIRREKRKIEKKGEKKVRNKKREKEVRIEKREKKVTV